MTVYAHAIIVIVIIKKKSFQFSNDKCFICSYVLFCQISYCCFKKKKRKSWVLSLKRVELESYRFDLLSDICVCPVCLKCLIIWCYTNYLLFKNMSILKYTLYLNVYYICPKMKRLWGENCHLYNKISESRHQSTPFHWFSLSFIFELFIKSYSLLFMLIIL